MKNRVTTSRAYEVDVKPIIHNICCNTIALYILFSRITWNLDCSRYIFYYTVNISLYRAVPPRRLRICFCLFRMSAGQDYCLSHFEGILEYVIPLLCGLILPLTLINVYLTSLQPYRTHPSLRLYFHLLLMDLMIVLGGVSLCLFFKSSDRSETNMTKVLFNNTMWLTFYCTGPLFFGLVLTRILLLREPISPTVPLGIIATAWFIALTFTAVHNTIKFPDYLLHPVPSTLQSVSILLMGGATLAMNFYILLALYRYRAYIPADSAGHRTAVMLFANCAICSLFTISLNFYFLVLYVRGRECAEDVDSGVVWPHFFICTKQGI